ncbi:hypothetical protein AB0O72_33450 [Streptomyces sp. NPDC088106]|uniref:hypothetical protein n=1 Tax=Streptomyces sp. NPDC088106 TaxID=3154867 RepID=UPI0034282DAC
MNDPLALLHAEAAAVNIDLTPDLLGRVMACFGEGVFAKLLDPHAGITVVAGVWNATYNKLEFEHAVIVCLALRRVLELGPSRLRPHLGALRWKATWCHVHLYLAGSLYQRSKELMGTGSGDVVRPMLTEALRCWDVVEPNDVHLAKGEPGRIWRGMRGVTRLVLARQDPSPLALLHGARTDLRLAEQRGDTTAEHFAFHLEVLHRLAQHPAELPTLWIEADQLAIRARPYVSGSFTWLCALGELHLRKAQSVVSAEDEPLFESPDSPTPDGESGVSDFSDEAAAIARRTAALEAYEEALRNFQEARDRATGREHGFRLVMLRHNHGVARAGIARTLQALRRIDEAQEHYVTAIEDMRWSASHDTPVQGSAFPSALIDYALYLYRAKDFAAARAHAQEAHLLCAASSGLLVESRERFTIELWRAAALRALWPQSETPSHKLSDPDVGFAPDPVEVRTRLDALLAAGPTESLSVVPLVLAAWLLIAQADTADLARVRATLTTLHTLRDTAPVGDRSWLSARLGMLYGQLDRRGRTVDGAAAGDPQPPLFDSPVAQAYAYFVDAVRETTVRRRHVEFGLGRAALHHAKALLAETGDSEAAVMLLHEAREVLLACLEEPAATDDASLKTAARVEKPLVRERVTSYLGETCLRLHTLTQDGVHLREAVNWFERTIAADDAVGNVRGMLGDAYLRLARAGGMHDLRTALAHKAWAREAGDRSRENLSVSAAGHHRLWRWTREPQEFVTAVDLALQAFGLDPDWPWPLLQLAVMAGASAAVVAPPEQLAAGVSGPGDAETDRLRAAVWAGDQGLFYERAARTAVHSQPFRRAVLGGRSETFVLDDPHRLLSTTLVLKPTYHAEAEAEQSHLGSLRQYLRDTAAPRWMRLPEVLALVDLPPDFANNRALPPDTALASRRAVGRSLAGVIADAYEGRRRSPRELVGSALRYLARIHVWSSGIAAPSGPGDAARAHAAVAAELKKRATELALPDACGLVERWEAAVRWPLASVPGRDAHAENWLITDAGDVVALDLEPHGRFPLLYEVVQLIEDHAALSLKESDWPEREALCQVYLDELTALRHPDTVAASDVLPTYQAFALVRAVFLVEHLTVGRSGVAATKRAPESTGSRRWAGRRLAHAHALVEHCAGTMTDTRLRDMALRLEALLPG